MFDNSEEATWFTEGNIMVSLIAPGNMMPLARIALANIASPANAFVFC